MIKRLTCLFFFFACNLVGARAADLSPLQVGVYENAPYVVQDDSGSWDGLAVNLWRMIAAREKLDYTLVPVDQDASMQELESGRIDVLLGQMSVSAERERLIDFSHAFLTEPLAIAVESGRLFPHWTEFLQMLPGHGVYSVILISFGGMLVFAILFWIVERRLTNSHFSGSPLQAIGSALWFSAVTMTTVGYGDKTPLTPVGRFLAFVWMFAGILLVGGFTATVASTVSTARMATAVYGLTDIARFQNGVLAGSAASNQLRNAGVVAERFDHVRDALAAVESGKVHTFVADFVTIRYELNQSRWSKLQAAVLHDTSSRMAIPVREGLPELEAINVGLLETLEDPSWQGVLRRWTGAPLPLGI